MATVKKNEAPKAEMVEREENAGSMVTTDRPAWMDPASNKGSEDVTARDMTLPRIDVLQALSPQLKKTDPTFIQGSEQGLIFNTVSGQLYGGQITIVPIVFRREYVIWQDRKSGGGYKGSFPTELDAENERLSLDNPDAHEVVETHVNFVLVLHEDGQVEEAVLSWSRSKRKTSRKLNSLVQMIPGDRYGRAYRLTAIPVSGPKGEYWSFDVSPVGYVNKHVYDLGARAYEAIKRGERGVSHENEYEAAETSATV